MMDDGHGSRILGIEPQTFESMTYPDNLEDIVLINMTTSELWFLKERIDNDLYTAEGTPVQKFGKVIGRLRTNNNQLYIFTATNRKRSDRRKDTYTSIMCQIERIDETKE